MRTLVALKSLFSGSFRLDARGFHHLGPFLSFGSEMRAELGRREQQRARTNLGKLGPDAGIGETRIHLAIEPLDDLTWRASRSPDAKPRRGFIARNRLCNGLNIGELIDARARRDRERPRRARPYVLHRARQHVEHHVHLAADEIGYGWRAAAIGHVSHAGAGHELEHLAAHV